MPHLLSNKPSPVVEFAPPDLSAVLAEEAEEFNEDTNAGLS
jgi:hypothetical protein